MDRPLYNGDGRLVTVGVELGCVDGATAVEMAGGSSTIGDSVSSPIKGLLLVAFSDD